jgi:hypothetical protein
MNINQYAVTNTVPASLQNAQELYYSRPNLTYS